MSSERSLPSDFIKSIYGKPVVVKFFSGVVYKGILSCLDGFLNIVLEQAEEYVDGNYTCRYSDCFLRGNNIMYISPNDELQ